MNFVNQDHARFRVLQEVDDDSTELIDGVTHSALGCPPIVVWQERVERIPGVPREPSDPTRFYLDFLPFEKRSVGRSGLRLFNVLYWHGALGPYVNDGRKHIVKYDSRDVSRVYLLEKDDCYLEIPYRDLSCGPASLEEVTRGARSLRAAGQSTEDQHKLFYAIQKQRELLNTAKSSTLKARRQAQVRTGAALKPFAAPVTERTLEPDADLPAEPFPFEFWGE